MASVGPADNAVDLTQFQDFISCVSKSLKIFCRSRLKFDSHIELVGYLNIRVDAQTKLDYVLNEKVLKTERERSSGEDSSNLTSKSFLARKDSVKFEPPSPDVDIAGHAAHSETRSSHEPIHSTLAQDTSVSRKRLHSDCDNAEIDTLSMPSPIRQARNETSDTVSTLQSNTSHSGDFLQQNLPHLDLDIKLETIKSEPLPLELDCEDVPSDVDDLKTNSSFHHEETSVDNIDQTSMFSHDDSLSNSNTIHNEADSDHIDINQPFQSISTEPVNAQNQPSTSFESHQPSGSSESRYHESQYQPSTSTESQISTNRDGWKQKRGKMSLFIILQYSLNI